MIFLEKMVIIPVDLLWPGVLSGPNEKETTRVKVQTNLFEDQGGEKSPKHKNAQWKHRQNNQKTQIITVPPRRNRCHRASFLACQETWHKNQTIIEGLILKIWIPVSASRGHNPPSRWDTDSPGPACRHPECGWQWTAGDHWWVGVGEGSAGGCRALSTSGFRSEKWKTGLMYLGAIFRESVMSQTCWCTLYSGAGVRWRSVIHWFRAAVVAKVARASHQTLWARRSWAWTEGAATSVSWLGNKGGWKPWVIMKKEILVAELTRELWAYSDHVRCADQEAGRQEATHCNEDSRSWFARSVWPLDCGW